MVAVLNLFCVVRAREADTPTCPGAVIRRWEAVGSRRQLDWRGGQWLSWHGDGGGGWQRWVATTRVVGDSAWCAMKKAWDGLTSRGKKGSSRYRE
ncbi:hypothetical protein GUJ93_ZPchr0012g20875 [Zizania palustris]|uniref:Secreted protein n=1 Tax=Zizania palustris TaxID=103762 RepID=A0A8J6BPD9_ZIZPA|nr:hypothetical protein GUJ93_ZPchr0012g20875 [Zizania palustris]